MKTNFIGVNNIKKNNEILITLIIIFFSFSLCSIGLRQRYGFILLGIITVFVGCKYCGTVINVSCLKKFVVFLFASLIIIYLIPSARYDIDTVSFFIYVFICVLTIIYSVTSYKEISKAFKIIELLGTIIALYITFFRIFPNLYFKLIYPFLSDGTAKMMLENSSVGYGAAIGQSYTFSDYFMMLGISSALGKNYQDIGKYNKKKVLIVILCSGILFEGRKGELLSTLLTLIFVSIIFCHPRKITYPKTKLMFWGIGILLAIVSIPIMYKKGLLYRFVLMLDRIQQKAYGMNVDFTSGRFTLWKNAISLFLSFPLLGAGWGRFANYTSGTFIEAVRNEPIKDVHNCFLQLLCETGLIGTLIILIPLFWIYKKTLLQTIRLKRNIRTCNKIIQMNIFALCMQTYFWILFFIDPVFYNPFYWCSFAIIIIIEDFALKEEKLLITNNSFQL
ncbi:MAG: O-antigen ligase family protein [Lachnospiraceae bacterium]|jgi:O-antigen ligase|nr:O-antigen ligase family protein [Lachnospiraceae bacterium]